MINILGILTNRLEKIESTIKYVSDPYDDDIFETMRKCSISEALGRIDELRKIAKIALDIETLSVFCTNAYRVEAKFRKLF